MRKSDLTRFFKQAGDRLSWPVEVYLTGGVLAWYYGGARPTQDIDFALKAEKDWDKTAGIFREVSRRLDIPVEFSEDISRWGMIGYPDFTRGAQLWESFGTLKVYLLDPVIWSVGKIARYTSDDIADLLAVFKKLKPNKKKVQRVWQEALEKSPRSSQSQLFKKKMADFFQHYEREIWE